MLMSSFSPLLIGIAIVTSRLDPYLVVIVFREVTFSPLLIGIAIVTEFAFYYQPCQQ